MKTWEDVQDVIGQVANDELSYDSDHITNDGWHFIENEAPQICLSLIQEDYELEEVGELTKEDIRNYFDDALRQASCLLRYE